MTDPCDDVSVSWNFLLATESAAKTHQIHNDLGRGRSVDGKRLVIFHTAVHPHVDRHAAAFGDDAHLLQNARGRRGWRPLLPSLLTLPRGSAGCWGCRFGENHFETVFFRSQPVWDASLESENYPRLGTVLRGLLGSDRMNRHILGGGKKRPQAVKVRVGKRDDQCSRRVLFHNRVGERLISLYDNGDAVRRLDDHDVADHPFRRCHFGGGRRLCHWGGGRMIGCASLYEHHQESQTAGH